MKWFWINDKNCGINKTKLRLVNRDINIVIKALFEKLVIFEYFWLTS